MEVTDIQRHCERCSERNCMKVWTGRSQGEDWKRKTDHYYSILLNIRKGISQLINSNQKNWQLMPVYSELIQLFILPFKTPHPEVIFWPLPNPQFFQKVISPCQHNIKPNLLCILSTADKLKHQNPTHFYYLPLRRNLINVTISWKIVLKY